MFNFFKAAQQFLDIQNVNDRPYVNGGKLKTCATEDVANGLKKNMKIPQMIEEFNLEYIIMTRGKNAQVANVDLDTYNRNPRRYVLYVCVDSVKSTNKLIEILRRKYPNYIEDTPDTNDSVEIIEKEEKAPIPDELEEKAPVPEEENMLYRGKDPCPIIDLEDYEKFTDADRIFEIEVRGERSPTHILFKVEDIARLFGMSNLTRMLIDKEIYQEGVHYIILSSNPDLHLKCKANPTSNPDSSLCPLKGNPDSSNFPQCGKVNSSSDKEHYKNRRAFLTWFGLFKVLFSSRSGNEYRQKMATWVMNTMFVHKFGSMTERKLLSDMLTMYNTCLNGTSGVYLICIGKVRDLRSSMNISMDKYPKDFDNANVMKYGRANNIMRRFGEHISKKNYGAYSDKIELTWFVILPEEKEKKAEKTLKGYFTDRNLRFEFTDNAGIRHDELIIMKRDEMAGVREEYMKLIHKYPSSENSIALMMDNIRSDYKAQIVALEHEKDIMIKTHEAELNKKDLELFKKDDIIKDERHKTELERHKTELERHKTELERHKTELMSKDMEILELKLAMASHK